MGQMMKDSELIFGLMAAFGKSEYTAGQLLHLTAPFGVSESSLRTSLSRMTGKTMLTVRRCGKTAYYRMGERGIRIRKNVSLGFGADDWQGWDGRFWGMLFSVPAQQAQARHRIRTKLVKRRFACQYPGFWVRPMRSSERVPEVFAAETATPHCRLIRFEHQEALTAAQAQELWQTDAVAARIKSGLTALERARLALRGVPAPQALIEKMTVGSEIAGILADDPLLPPQYLPENWAADALRHAWRAFDRDATAASRPYWQEVFESEEDRHENR